MTAPAPTPGLRERVELTALERARRLYRGLDMQADIMRDPSRTGGGQMARRVANAFARQAQAARDLHDQIEADSHPQPH